MKNSQKGFVIPLLILIGVLTVSGSIYYVYSTSNQNTKSDQNNIQGVTSPTNSLSENVDQVPSNGLSSAIEQQIANKTKDVAIENNVSSTRDFITEYYKSDNNPCINKYVVDSIKTSTVGKVKCQSNATSYAVSQALISAPTALWCADSSGFANQGIIVYQQGKYSCKATNISIPVTPKYIKSSVTIKNNSGIQSQSQTDPDITMKAQLNMAKTDIENYFSDSNSYAGFCANNQNYSDIKQSLVTYKYHAYTLSCKDSNIAYAISSNMIVGGFWCIDSTGYSGPAKSLNTQTSCVK